MFFERRLFRSKHWRGWRRGRTESFCKKKKTRAVDVLKNEALQGFDTNVLDEQRQNKVVVQGAPRKSRGRYEIGLRI